MHSALGLEINIPGVRTASSRRAHKITIGAVEIAHPRGPFARIICNFMGHRIDPFTGNSRRAHTSAVPPRPIKLYVSARFIR